MLPSRQIKARLLLFTLFGDYIYPREGWAWTSSLIKLLALLGLTPEAARLNLSRLAQQGWLQSERRGRHSLYRLTRAGRHLLQEGTQRIFEPRTRSWDKRWRVVVYSLPESKRDLRETLRRRLGWLGFGALGPGTWISPHDRRTELRSLLADLRAHRFARCFEGRSLDGNSHRELVSRCWNLGKLNKEYARFLARWEPRLRSLKKARRQKISMKGSECFVQRFWIIHEYREFVSRDPNLPRQLLPSHWQGGRAAEVFRSYRRLLTEPASRFIDKTLQTTTKA